MQTNILNEHGDIFKGKGLYLSKTMNYTLKNCVWLGNL